jgi:hypothetical protein
LHYYTSVVVDLQSLSTFIITFSLHSLLSSSLPLLVTHAIKKSTLVIFVLSWVFLVPLRTLPNTFEPWQLARLHVFCLNTLELHLHSCSSLSQIKEEGHVRQERVPPQSCPNPRWMGVITKSENVA